jgi:hypothetical protein
MTRVTISFCDLNCADIYLHIPYTTSWCGAKVGLTFSYVCSDGINAYGSVCFHCSLQLQGRNVRSRSESEVSDPQSRARGERLYGSAISNIRHSRMTSYKQHTCNALSQRRHLRPNVCDLHSLPENRIL